MINGYQESIFFHYILGNQIFLKSTKSEFFLNQNLRELFEIAKDHAIRYKEAPSKEQLSELVNIKGLGEKYNAEIIEALYNTKEQLKNYDKDWLEENVGPWIRVRNLDNVMRKSIAFMKTNKVTAENASEIVEKVRHMMTTETAIDFSFNLGVDFFDPTSHKQERLARTTTGYPYIDKCLKGGWWKGSLIVFLSGPKSGKCSTGDTYINVRNKKTGEIQKIQFQKFYNIIKSYYTPEIDKSLRSRKIFKLKNESE